MTDKRCDTCLHFSRLPEPEIDDEGEGSCDLIGDLFTDDTFMAWPFWYDRKNDIKTHYVRHILLGTNGTCCDAWEQRDA